MIDFGLNTYVYYSLLVTWPQVSDYLWIHIDQPNHHGEHSILEVTMF
jgi:hypothetical protein